MEERIKKIAEDNGFEFNASARGLITSRVGTIAVILPHNFDQFQVNVFHSELHNYLRMTLEREDFDLLVTFHKNRFTGSNNINRMSRLFMPIIHLRKQTWKMTLFMSTIFMEAI